MIMLRVQIFTKMLAMAGLGVFVILLKIYFKNSLILNIYVCECIYIYAYVYIYVGEDISSF